MYSISVEHCTWHLTRPLFSEIAIITWQIQGVGPMSKLFFLYQWFAPWLVHQLKHSRSFCRLLLYTVPIKIWISTCKQPFSQCELLGLLDNGHKPFYLQYDRLGFMQRFRICLAQCTELGTTRECIYPISHFPLVDTSEITIVSLLRCWWYDGDCQHIICISHTHIPCVLPALYPEDRKIFFFVRETMVGEV